MPLDPLSLAAIASIGSSVVKAGTGVMQGIRARKIARQAGARPEYEIPESVDRAIASQQGLVSTRMPGQTAMEEGIEAGTASAVDRVTEAGAGSGSILNTIANLQANEARAKQQVGIEAAKNYVNQARALQSMYMQRGAMEEKEFMMNEMQPWEQAMQTASALRGAATQNISSGITEGAGSLAGFLGNKPGDIDTGTRNVYGDPTVSGTIQENIGMPTKENPWKPDYEKRMELGTDAQFYEPRATGIIRRR